MKASISNYRQSPRKVRLVASAIAGKSVPVALTSLQFLDKRASEVIEKLLASAVANAKNTFQMDPKDLIVKECRVDAGVTLHRIMPRARGSAAPIKKRSSHILITLAVKPAPVEKKGKAAKKVTDAKK